MKKGYLHTVQVLLDGGSVVATGKNGYRVRDAAHRVVLKMSGAFFQELKPVLRRKGGAFVLNRSEVRQLHGNTHLKQLYRLQLQKKETPAGTNSKGPQC